MKFEISHIKATNIELTPKLQTLVEQKFASLGKFIREGEEFVCNIELERVTGHHSGEIYRMEVNLTLQGKMYRAEATTNQIEKSIDTARNEISSELRKAHDRSKTMFRRGGAAIKRMMQFGK